MSRTEIEPTYKRKNDGLVFVVPKKLFSMIIPIRVVYINKKIKKNH